MSRVVCHVIGCHAAVTPGWQLCPNHQPPVCVCDEPHATRPWGECATCFRPVLIDAAGRRLTERWRRVLRDAS